jgi:hypothetical protein
MIEISLEKEKIIKSLKELEKEFTKGNIPKSHYISQKRKLTEQLDAFEVADRVRKLQGKETAEVIDDEVSEEEENGELFKKYITPTGLKEKNIQSEGKSLNTKIAASILIAAFFIGIVFGVYGFIPQQVSSASLFTNDTAFPPFVLNNTTNATNSTNMTKNMTKNETKNVTKNTTVTKPANTTKPKTNNSGSTHSGDSNVNDTPAAGDPTTHKTTRHSTPSDQSDNQYYNPDSEYSDW